MATGKRYYWMKLKESFMTSDTIDYFMSQPDGANYVVLYQMLCLKTINTDGRLSRQIGEVIIPYDVSKIQRDLKWFTTDTVRVALNLYKSVGLIYEDVDGTLVLTDHNSLVGSETDWAVKKSRQRSVPADNLGNGKALPCGDNVPTNVHENVPTDIDIDIRDKRLDIRDKDLDIRESKTRTRACRDDDFDAFWAVYPRKVGKGEARKAFAKVKAPVSMLIEAVNTQKQSHQWTKNGGEYIPNPATWLNQGRWEDSLPPAESTKGVIAHTEAHSTDQLEYLKAVYQKVKGESDETDDKS